MKGAMSHEILRAWNRRFLLDFYPESLEPTLRRACADCEHDPCECEEEEEEEDAP